MNRTVFTAIGIFVLLCSTLHGQAPQLINYQGRVVVGTTNFNGTGRFKFALVNATNSSSTATAAADVISAGVIEHIKITTPGNGYTSPPTVTINDTGGGSGATATATVMFGRINKINISNGGSNYTGTTTVTIGPPPSNTNFTYWSNDGTSVNGSEPTNYVSIGVTNGLYSVLLGDTSLANMTAVSNFVAAYASADMRLRVWFDDGVHGSQLLSPDQRIGSVVYAFGASILGDPSTATDISTSGNQLNLEASGIIKLNTGGNMTGVNVTTSFSPSTGNHVLNIDSDLTTPGEVIADYIISAGAEFSAGISGTSAGFSGDVNAHAFNATSDRNAKEHFGSINAREVLAQLVRMPIQTWNFKEGDSGVPHIGPMAQDFHAAFQVGPDDKHISTVDADGVAFAAIQGLNEIVQEQNAELAAKAKEIDALKNRLDEVEKILKPTPTK